jgi:hypothetical protein
MSDQQPEWPTSTPAEIREFNESAAALPEPVLPPQPSLCPVCLVGGILPAHAPECPVGQLADAGRKLQEIRSSWRHAFGTEPVVRVSIHVDFAIGEEQ